MTKLFHLGQTQWPATTFGSRMGMGIVENVLSSDSLRKPYATGANAVVRGGEIV